ncbi:MAG: peptidase, partial [Clostridia bacterium]|nr:peptidase [Clostridia bacterium]
MGPFIVAGVIVAVLLLLVISNIHIVPQAHAYIVERLGSYHATWSHGIQMKVPFIDRINKKINLMEQVVDFPPQSVI